MHPAAPTSPTSLALAAKRAEIEGRLLVKKVRQILDDEGFLKRIEDSSNGAYLIKDKSGTTVAIFKPDDERNWGPNHQVASHRRAEPSDADIAFHQMSSFEQGKPSQRQYLSQLFDAGEVARLPAGFIAEIESDRFVDLEAQKTGAAPQLQRKIGYLQAWVQNGKMLAAFHPSGAAFLKDHPNAVSLPDEAYHLKGNPMLDLVPLDEFQRVGIRDVLLYNEDGHPGNLLVRIDEKGIPHLISIDQDAILPWRLQDLKSVLTHPRAALPFTDESAKFLSGLDPAAIAAVVQKVGLPQQAATNARALAIALKRFGRDGLTLADLHSFIAKNGDTAASPLWKLMKEAKQAALDALPQTDRAMVNHEAHLQWTLWWEHGEQAPADAYHWLSDYRRDHKKRIDAAIDGNFWKEFAIRMDNSLESLRKQKESSCQERSL